MRVANLGVGTRPIGQKELTVENLAAAISITVKERQF